MSLGVVVAGCGNWGPRLVRVLSGLPGVAVRGACDPDPAARERLGALWPELRLEPDLTPFLGDPSVQAAALATPAATHAGLARRCLDAGLHVLVEKPVGVDLPEVQDLSVRARKAGRLLMGGHVYLYHPAVRAAKGVLDRGDLGPLRHVRSLRVNPGPVRPDVSVMGDLLPHDLSMLWLWLDGAEPTRVHAVGSRPLGTERVDTAFVTLAYAGGPLVQLAASWVEPAKVRRSLLVGERGALEFDDLDPAGPLRLLEPPGDGAPLDPGPGRRTRVPVEEGEPLREECLEFVRRIERGAVGPSPENEAVARVLARLEESLRRGGPA